MRFHKFFSRFLGSLVSGITALLLALLLLGVAGCSSQSTSSYGKEIGGFLGGDQGVVINVIDGAPPSVIQDASLTPFSFVITLENVGEAKIGKDTQNPFVMARIMGINPRDFGLTEDTAIKKLGESLESAKKNIDGSITPGEITYLSFEDLAYKNNIDTSAAVTFRAEVCYDYESYASAKFCMKNDFVESAEDSTICMLRGPRPYGNSGAPLHVTEVYQAPVNQDTIQLNFNIEHFGNGIYFYRNTPKDNYDSCVFSDMDPNIYKLELIVEPVQKDTYEINCMRLDEKVAGGGAKGIVRSSMNAPIAVSCFIKRTKPTEVRVYEDLVKITLRYRYGEFLEVPVLIQGHP
ncbi:hypothetical protein JW711_01115 [Candidatus Woesearchaeota archaeon]|nr:hypothetical protein [Candidatus Woesearchaeota archaeon]